MSMDRAAADSRGVVVWWLSEEERQGDPEARRAPAGGDVDEDSLDERWLGNSVLGHADQDAEVAFVLVLRGIVWKDPIQHGAEPILRPDSDVERHAPGDVLRDDPGYGAREERTQRNTRKNDGNCGRTPFGWG